LRIHVLGAGGHAKVVISSLRACGFSDFLAYDDDESRWGQTVLGVTIAGGTELCPQEPAVIAIGSNRIRKILSEKILAEWKTVVHPSAIVDPTVKVGKGTVVFAGVVVQADTTLGEHVILNTRCSVDHDGFVGDFAQLCPAVTVAGTVIIGEGAFLGSACTVVPGVRISDGVIVGAGAVVTRNLETPGTYFGVPAVKKA